MAALVRVNYCRGNTLLPMGRLALKEHQFFFEYDQSFLGLGLELSPFKLPLKPGVLVCETRVFEGLFGVFNDSLPDGWGRLLLDRKLTKTGVLPGTMTPLDRLMYIGGRTMGALQYQPEISGQTGTPQIDDLDVIAEECYQVQEHDSEQFVDDLLVMNGSSAGARPKILVTLVPKKNEFQVTKNTLSGSHNDWIIKFRSSMDPKDVGAIEYAYHLMAKKAGLDLPEARLFSSKTGSGYFGVKRFDRLQSKFMHMHTISGLLHADHRIPSLDYETILKVTLRLTKDAQECEKQFRNAIFNVLAHNRDDHAKNFSFLMDENGVWRVSPAYDLVFSSGPGGEHCTTMMGEGKTPTIQHCLKLALIAGIKREKALEIIDQVRCAIVSWKEYAKEANVSLRSMQLIQKTLAN